MLAMLVSLWLSIVLSAVAVFVVSALGWMFVNHHAKDWGALPDESKTLETLRGMHIPPGVYGFPYLTHKEASTPEGKAKWMAGPCGTLRIWRNPNMGANMFKSFLVYLVVSAGIGYLGSAALPRGADFARVFQVMGTAGVLAYAFAFIPNDIWFQNSRRATTMCVIDGIVYGLVTGAIFAALWPKA